MPIIPRRFYEPNEYFEVLEKHPDLRPVFDHMLDLIGQYGVPKLGRWVYCKYCYMKVLPRLNFPEGLVQCTECIAGLAPLENVIKAGAYSAWEATL